MKPAARTNLADLAAIVAPPPRLKISEWAEQEVYIPPEGNAEPGKYHLSRMPHQAAMLDDPLEPGVREIFWMLAAQAGGKTLSLNIIAMFIIHQLKQSILMVRPTIEFGIEWMRDKFLPMTRATPCMMGLLKEPRQRDSESTMKNRKFPGGSLRVVGARSPTSMRGTSVPKILQDEIDSYEANKEGDPCDLADRAAITFTNAWKIKCSTPTLAGFSRIHEGYLRGDQQKYFVPCPCCGEFQNLVTEQLKFSFTAEEHARMEDRGSRIEKKFHPNDFTWDIGNFNVYDTRRAMYVCIACRRGWTDAQRMASYNSGHPDNPPVTVKHAGKTLKLRARWQATAEFKGIRSRHQNGMYLTIGLEEGMENYLHQFAEKFLAAKAGGREKLMVWTNIFKCEPFEDESEKLSWQPIKDRAEDYGPELPVEVMFLIAGMDVHPDRVEIHVLGWGAAQQVWGVEYQVIYGDFDMPEMQSRVEDYLLNRRFTHPVLGELDIRACGIDSGHQTKVKAVYHFSRKHFTRNFWAVKGFADPLGSLYTATVEKRLRLTRFNLNVDVLKATIYDRLKNTEPGANYIHFPKEEVSYVGADGKPAKLKTNYTTRFYTQLCSERRFPERKKDGSVVYRWKKPTSSTRNEALDTTVYAFGVFEIVKQVGYIERRWKEVCEKLAQGEDGGSRMEDGKKTEPKTYHIKPEAKLAELKQVQDIPRKPAPAKTPKFGGWNKGYSGKWR